MNETVAMPTQHQPNAAMKKTRKKTTPASSTAPKTFKRPIIDKASAALLRSPDPKHCFGCKDCLSVVCDSHRYREFDRFDSLYISSEGFDHCPFCGRQVLLVVRQRAGLPDTYNFHCSNNDCLLSRSRMNDTPDFSSKEEIAALWNERASGPKFPSIAEILR